MVLRKCPDQSDWIAQDERIVAQCGGHLSIISSRQVAALSGAANRKAQRRDFDHAPGKRLRRWGWTYYDIQQPDCMMVAGCIRVTESTTLGCQHKRAARQSEQRMSAERNFGWPLSSIAEDQSTAVSVRSTEISHRHAAVGIGTRSAKLGMCFTPHLSAQSSSRRLRDFNYDECEVAHR